MQYIVAALAVAVGLLGWMLKGAWEDSAAKEQVIGLLTVERDNALTEKVTLDAMVTELRKKAAESAARMKKRETQLKEVKDEGCLDRPVPAALDGWLRND